MCVYLYMHNKYTQYTHTHYVNKTLFWTQLFTINRLTALTWLHFVCVCVCVCIY